MLYYSIYINISIISLSLSLSQEYIYTFGSFPLSRVIRRGRATSRIASPHIHLLAPSKQSSKQIQASNQQSQLATSSRAEEYRLGTGQQLNKKLACKQIASQPRAKAQELLRQRASLFQPAPPLRQPTKAGRA